MHKRIDLAAVDASDFINMVPNRLAKIAAAPATELPKHYPINNLAQALHPEEQYLVIERIIPRSNDIKSYIMVPDLNRGTESCAYFKAGQYLSIMLNIDGAVLSRPYSICSAPLDALKGKYMITVKRVKEGFASSYILDNWSVGTQVTASAPIGEFTFEPLRDKPEVIGLAGGSGITPFYSLACAIADGLEDCNLTVLYGSRNKDEIILRAEFEELVKRCNRIKVVHVLNDEKEEGFEFGFLSAELIKKYAPSGDFSVFVCGSKEMYNFVEKEVAKLFFPPGRVRYELFGEYKHPELEALYPQNRIDKQFSLKVSLRGEKKTIPCNSGESLLVAMERQGIAAPAHCRSGECGYCHSRLIRGEVYIPESVDSRRLADKKFGYVHPCCTFPLSDVEMEVPIK